MSGRSKCDVDLCPSVPLPLCHIDFLGTNDPYVVSSETGNPAWSGAGVFVAASPEEFAYPAQRGTGDDDPSSPFGLCRTSGNPAGGGTSLLSDGRFEYSWDAENRLISATTTTNLPADVPVVHVAFDYDYQSRRVAKNVYEWDEGVTNWVEQSTATFLYDGWNLVQEVSTQDSEVSTNHYVWGLDLSCSLQGAGGIGGLLAVVNGTNAYFPTFDGNGNVSEYLDASGGIVAHYEYSPFGETVVATGPNASDFLHRFSTKYFDPETGLYYYGYRFYSPGVGRWVSRDPIKEKAFASLFDPSMSYQFDSTISIRVSNLYCFSDNGPISKKDFLGLLCFPGSTKRMNEVYNPPKDTTPWIFRSVHFEDLVQGNDLGSGVGAYTSYVCSYYRKLRKEYDKYRCTWRFCWKLEGRFNDIEVEYIHAKHGTGYDYIVPSPETYREFGNRCKQETPSATYEP